MRESASDSGYGHESISCMTYNIHVDILLGCLFVCATIACALRFLYWLCSPRRGTPFQVHEKTALLQGREYKEGQAVALRSIL